MRKKRLQGGGGAAVHSSLPSSSVPILEPACSLSGLQLLSDRCPVRDQPLKYQRTPGNPSLAYSLREVFTPAKAQQQEWEAAGHMASAARKQRDMNAVGICV